MGARRRPLECDLWSEDISPPDPRGGEGHIVNTASSQGLQSGPEIGTYNVAKFGVVALSETLQLELLAEDSTIGASVLCPGAIATRITESGRNRPDAAADTETDQRFRLFASKIVGDGQSPESVAERVVHAIKAKEFWILTHEDWIDVLRKRVEGMADGRKLVMGFGG